MQHPIHVQNKPQLSSHHGNDSHIGWLTNGCQDRRKGSELAKGSATWYGSWGGSGSSQLFPNFVSWQAASKSHAKQAPMIKPSWQRFKYWMYWMTYNWPQSLIASRACAKGPVALHILGLEVAAPNLFQIVWVVKWQPIHMQNKPQWYSHTGDYPLI